MSWGTGLWCVGALALASLWAEGARSQDNARPLYVIFDSSSSMWGSGVSGAPKYKLAADALTKLSNLDLSGRKVYFRAYGAEPANRCADSKLIGAAQDSENVRRVASEVSGLKPAGKSALELSLKQAAKDLAGQPADIALFVDGATDTENSCPGDPCALAQTWNESGSPIRVHVIDFGQAQSEQLACISAAQKTAFVSVNDFGKFVPVAPPKARNEISRVKKMAEPSGVDWLSWFGRTFWTDLTQAQAALLTSIIALLGALVAYQFLKKQIDSVKQTLLEAEGRFQSLIETMQKQLVELDSAVSSVEEKVEGVKSNVLAVVKVTVEKADKNDQPPDQKG